MGNAIALYGITHESFVLTSRLSPLAKKLYVIDEDLGVAYELFEELLPIGKLLSVDSLRPIVPAGKALSEAGIILYSPKYRRIDEKRARLSDIDWHVNQISRLIGRGSLLINLLPLGMGENQRLLSMLEARGKRPSYYYVPLKPNGEPSGVLGLPREQEKGLPDLMRNLGLTEMTLEEAERAHVSTVLKELVPLYLDVALKRNVSTDKHIHDLARGLLEAMLVGTSAETGDPLYNLYNFTKKTLESYMKKLIAKVKTEIKKREMKISRAKLLVAWSYNDFSMRGDEAWCAHKLATVLSSSFIDVTMLNRDYEKGVKAGRYNVIIVCSKQDEALVNRLRGDTPRGTVIIRACIPEPEVVEDKP